MTLGRPGAELTESSGIAVSRRHSDRFWSHNDGEEGRLYGLAMGPDSASGGSGVRPAELMGMLPLDVSAS